jgi:hypothetical protein
VFSVVEIANAVRLGSRPVKLDYLGRGLINPAIFARGHPRKGLRVKFVDILAKAKKSAVISSFSIGKTGIIPREYQPKPTQPLFIDT